MSISTSEAIVPLLVTLEAQAAGVLSARAATSSSAFNPNPTTPDIVDDAQWIVAYLTIHETSDSSYRYAYLLWIAVVFVFLAFAILHLTGRRGGFIGAYWSKWSLRRRTWRKEHSLAVARRNGQPHKQPLSLPSNAQILCLSILVISSLALCFVGPDYIAPQVPLWDFVDGNSTAGWRRDGALSVNLDAAQPQFTIHKEWWTSANRTGIIAFALFPLCVLFALKSPPFAIFAIPFMIQFYFDKLYALHRWAGRVIWFISALHVAFWSVQLAMDHRTGTNNPVWLYVWEYDKFISGCVAFVLLTILVIMSLRPIRNSHYELFYALHVVLVVLTLVASGLHHPPVAWWCWAALALWAGERLWRGTWWLHMNGFFGGMSTLPIAPTYVPQSTGAAFEKVRPPRVQQQLDEWEMQGLRSPELGSSGFSHSPLSPSGSRSYPPSSNNGTVLHSASSSTRFNQSLIPSLRPLYLRSPPFTPPPGYAHAELLPGRTIRLRIITPGFVAWAPGQHMLVCLPSISRVTSHPFTIASVCDEQAPGDDKRQIVLLIRTKKGWTKRLWDTIVLLLSRGRHCPSREEPAIRGQLPARGVLMRAFVDGPFGSAIRARWGAYSTAVIVVGGAGVSFGASVMEYLCMCMTGRDGKYLGSRPGGWGQSSFRTRRIRFIWLVREFSHIQWCASIIRRCMTMLPSPGLQVDIFVTNFKPTLHQSLDFPALRGNDGAGSRIDSDDNVLFVPPTPRFAQPQSRGRRDSIDSIDTLDSPDDDVDLSYYFSEDKDTHGYSNELGHEEDVLDFTNFDGDNDDTMPGEAQLSKKVKQEGKLRRAKSKRAAAALAGPSKAPGLPVTPKKQKPYHMSASSTDHLLPQSPHTSESIHYFAGHRSRISELDITSPLAMVPHEFAPEPFGVHERRSQAPAPLVIPESLSNSQSPTTPRIQSALSHISAKSIGGSESVHELLPKFDTGTRGNEVRLDLDEREVRDLDIVAEHARPGKPKLNRILAEEVEDSQGAVIVACCGPTSLNAVLRKTIAAQIDPSRIRRGDMRGSIALVSEEFQF